MTKCLAKAPRTVVKQAVAHQFALSVGQDGALQENGLSAGGVVIAQLRIDMVLVTYNVRRAHDVGNLGLRIVAQGIGCQDKLRIDQPHIIIEHGILGCRTILSPIRSQHIFLVGQRSPVEEIAQIEYTVVVQAVGDKLRLAILHLYILAKHRNL